MAAGRLDASSLEAALQTAFKDQDGEVMIRGKETVGQIDANFAGKLHEKLAQQADNPVDEPSGMRAPACTMMLSAQDLAALDDEDEEEKVVLDTHNHGVIDQVDAKLVTELNKKLSDEASDQRDGGRAGSKERTNGDFSHDLSSALQQKLGGQGDDEISAAVERRFSAMATQDDEDKGNASGLRAPQCTVKLSAEALAALDDDDDEVMDSAMLVAQAHGKIADVDNGLVAELQKKLGSQEIQAPNHGNIDRIDANLVSTLQQKLEGDLNVRIACDDDNRAEMSERGCRAPQSTMKLTEDMLAGIEVDDDDEDPLAGAKDALSKLTNDPSPTQGLDAEEAALERSGGLRAPLPTKLITSDMLAGLDDEDDIDVAPDPTANTTMLPKASGTITGATTSGGGDTAKNATAKPKKGVGFSSSAGGFDPKFADSLQHKLEDVGGLVISDTRTEEPPEDFGDGDIEPGYKSGLKAPSCTQALTAEQLLQLNDEEDLLDQPARGFDAPVNPTMGGARALPTNQVAPRSATDRTSAMPQGGPSAAELATLSAAAAALQDITPTGEPPQQQDPGIALTASDAQRVASKVINTARGLPEGPDVWGQPRPLTTSCKLRLAWLSKEEVQKENDVLRKEIASLRAEIEMHRQLARKACSLQA